MKLPAIWRKKRKNKKEYGNRYATIRGVDVNLGTEDMDDARTELRRRMLEQAAAASEPDVEDGGGGGGEAASGGETPAPIPAPLPTSPPPAPIVPELVSQGTGVNPPPPSSEADARAEADATNAAAAETAGGADPPLPPAPEISNKELALLGVEAQLWVAQQYARNKVWKGYTAPQLPPEAKAPLAAQWEKIITYADLGAKLPPWVTGLVIPGVTIVVATASLGQVFAEQAAEQKRAAGIQDERKPADAPPAQAAA